MFLKSQTLDISFWFLREGTSYMIYASIRSMWCFECGDVGHKKLVSPHKTQGEEGAGYCSNVVNDEEKIKDEDAFSDISSISELDSLITGEQLYSLQETNDF